MKLTFAIEASQSCGTSFRLAIGVTIPLTLVWMAIKITGLFL